MNKYAGGCKYYKIAFEESDKEHPYLHTHIVVEWNNKVDTNNIQCFDYDKIHPHIYAINNDQYYCHLWKKYLEGYKKSGYVKPIEIYTSEVEPVFIEDKKRKFDELCNEIVNENTWTDALQKYRYEISKKYHFFREYYHTAKKTCSPCNIIKLRRWQKELLNLLLTKPHPRHIYWVWEEKGNTGKSEFINYLINNHNAFLAECEGKDIIYAYNGQPIVCFDYERAYDEKFIQWKMIERFKNGRAMNQKYHSSIKCYDRPHVVIFSNMDPDLININKKISKDRIINFEIKHNILWLPHYELAETYYRNVKIKFNEILQNIENGKIWDMLQNKWKVADLNINLDID